MTDWGYDSEEIDQWLGKQQKPDLRDKAMTDVVKELQAYLDGDNSVVMSKRLVRETIAELAAIRPAVIEECAAYLDSIHHNSTAKLLRRAMNKGGGDERIS